MSHASYFQNKSNLGEEEKGCILAYNSKLQSIVVGKSKWELEIAGHIVARVENREQ